MKEFIPVCEPLLNGNELEYVTECIRTNWISSEGPFVKKFENEVADHCKRDYAVTVSNGTAALDLLFYALNLKEGDEVIVPNFTIISCINQLIRMGVKPVFVDMDINTFNIDAKAIKDKVTSKTKAILIVHIYGLTCDVDPIQKICEDHNLMLIEDAAEALGQTYKGRPCGTFGLASTLSFYSNKFVTTGEGGMILTNSAQLKERLELLRNLAFEKSTRFRHSELGWNMRMSNLQAALGVAQMEQLSKTLLRKRKIGYWYHEFLNDLKEIRLAPKELDYCENAYWVCPIMLNTESAVLKEFREYLDKNRIGSRPFFHPLDSQPVVLKYMGKTKEEYPQSKLAYETGIYLPNGLGLTKSKVKYISEIVRAFFDK